MPPEKAKEVIGVARNLYDHAVANCDAQFGRMVDALEQKNLRQSTVLVVTADHGEEFLEHKFLGHSQSLYAELVDVPLIMSYPPALPAGAHVRGPVGLIDVAPTLQALAGLPADASMSGIDLLPQIRNGDTGSARPYYLVRRPMLDGAKKDLVPKMEAVVSGSWKLIHNHGDVSVELGRRPEWELFDDASDPGETVNLAEKDAATLRRMQALLEKGPGSHASPAVKPAPAPALDPATRERLRALGYGVE